MIVGLIVRNKSSKISDKLNLLGYKLTILRKKRKNKQCFKKTVFFTTIRRFAVESSEKRLYVIYK